MAAEENAPETGPQESLAPTPENPQPTATAGAAPKKRASVTKKASPTAASNVNATPAPRKRATKKATPGQTAPAAPAPAPAAPTAAATTEGTPPAKAAKAPLPGAHALVAAGVTHTISSLAGLTDVTNGKQIRERFLSKHVKENPAADINHIRDSIGAERRAQIGPEAPGGKGEDGKWFVGTPGTKSHRTFTTEDISDSDDYSKVLAHHKEQHGTSALQGDVQEHRRKTARASVWAPHEQRFAAGIQEIVDYKTPMMAGETQEQATAREAKSNPTFGMVYLQARDKKGSSIRNVQEHIPVHMLKDHIAALPGTEVWVDHRRLDSSGETYAHAVTGVRPDLLGGKGAFRGVESLPAEEIQRRRDAGIAISTVHEIAGEDFHSGRMPRTPVGTSANALGNAPAGIAQVQSAQERLGIASKIIQAQIGQAGEIASTLISEHPGMDPEEAEAFRPSPAHVSAIVHRLGSNADPADIARDVSRHRENKVAVALQLIRHAQTMGVEPPPDFEMPVTTAGQVPHSEVWSEYTKKVAQATAHEPHLVAALAKASLYWKGAESGGRFPASKKPLVRARGDLNAALQRVQRIKLAGDIGASRQTLQQLSTDQAENVAAESAGSLAEAVIEQPKATSPEETAGVHVSEASQGEVALQHEDPMGRRPTAEELAKLGTPEEAPRFASENRRLGAPGSIPKGILPGDRTVNDVPETPGGLARVGLLHTVKVVPVRDHPGAAAATYLKALSLHHADGDPWHLVRAAADIGPAISSPTEEEIHSELGISAEDYAVQHDAADGKGQRSLERSKEQARQDAFTRKIHNHPVFGNLLGHPTQEANAQAILGLAEQHGIHVGDGSIRSIGAGATDYLTAHANELTRQFDPNLGGYAPGVVPVSQTETGPSIRRGVEIGGRPTGVNAVTPAETAYAHSVLDAMARNALPGGARRVSNSTNAELEENKARLRAQSEELLAEIAKHPRTTTERSTGREIPNPVRVALEGQHARLMQEWQQGAPDVGQGAIREEKDRQARDARKGMYPKKYARPDVTRLEHLLTGMEDHTQWELVPPAEASAKAFGHVPEPGEASTVENNQGVVTIAEQYKRSVDEKADIERYNKSLAIVNGPPPFSNKAAMKTYLDLKKNLQVGPPIQQSHTPEELAAKHKRLVGMLLSEKGIVNLAEEYDPEVHGQWDIRPKAPRPETPPGTPEERTAAVQAQRAGQAAVDAANAPYARELTPEEQAYKYDPEVMKSVEQAKTKAAEEALAARLPPVKRHIDLLADHPTPGERESYLEDVRLAEEQAAQVAAAEEAARPAREAAQAASQLATSQANAASAAEEQRQRLIAERAPTDYSPLKLPAPPPQTATPEERAAYVAQHNLVTRRREVYLRQRGVIGADEGPLAVNGDRRTVESARRNLNSPGGPAVARGLVGRGPLDNDEVNRRWSQHVAEEVERRRIAGLTTDPYAAIMEQILEVDPNAPEAPGFQQHIEETALTPEDAAARDAAQAAAVLPGRGKPQIPPGGIGDITTVAGPIQREQAAQAAAGVTKKPTMKQRRRNTRAGKRGEAGTRTPTPSPREPGITPEERTRRVMMAMRRSPTPLAEPISPRSVSWTGAVIDSRRARQAQEAVDRLEQNTGLTFSNEGGEGTGTTLGTRARGRRGGKDNRAARKARQRGKK